MDRRRGIRVLSQFCKHPYVCPAVALLGLWLIGAPPADAASGPHWSIVAQSEPTYFKAGDAADAYRLIVRNDGGAQTERGTTVKVTDTLPPGVTATKVSGGGEAANGSGFPKYSLKCPEGPVTGALVCTYEEDSLHGAVLAGATISITITVSGVGLGGSNYATVSGGGAPSASVREEAGVGEGPVPFGMAYFTAAAVGEGGEAAIQAGSHPFELTASLAFNISAREPPGTPEAALADAAPRDLEVALPVGLVGNPSAVPQCSQAAFQVGEKLNCPLDTQVGTVKPLFYGTFPAGVIPVFNIAPPPGQPAELGFTIAGFGHVPIFFHLRRGGGGYGLVVNLHNIPETGPLQGAILTLWGVPADGSHDLEREGTSGEGNLQREEFCEPEIKVEGGVEQDKRCPSGIAAKPFLTLPGRCEGALSISAFSDSWQPSEPTSELETKLAALDGCEHLSFTPSIAVAPETTQAGSPSGYTVDIHVPQHEDPSALATPDLRRAILRLPAGTVVSPSVADGLQGCSSGQFDLASTNTANCPGASQIGTVEITTPLLSSPLRGGLFLAAPACAPCTPSDAREGRMIRLLLQAEGSGLNVKLEGSVSVDQDTGQLTVSFEEDPQLPFEDLKLSLNGGPRAPLANPSTCGVSLATFAELAPYSGQAPAQQSSQPYELSGCPAPQFRPSFIAGTTNNEAGAFSPATVTLSRSDHDENFEAITLHTPPGLIGMLSKVAPCLKAQVLVHACGPESHLGSASVGAGPGSSPFFLHGDVYLTGPHDGAPFGLSIVVAALAGPLNLGTLEVGASVNLDPTTAALTITSDPLPRSLDGIPLQIRTISLDLDRRGFIVNPTSCTPSRITAALRSAQGSIAAVSSRFQAASCATLAFRPKLTAVTHAWTSKALGVYLHVKLQATAGQANFAKLKLDLPRQLPARLSTLRNACLASVFAANPAGCPAVSVLGTASAATPVLASPLRGPVYLVSHGGSAAPALEIVLQGEGVILRLDGQTSISHGIASSAFRTLPDAPISTFDLVLDDGSHSALGANLPRGAGRSMCAQRLAMPIAITAQNGAVVKQTTKIAVSGCASKHNRKPERSSRKRARAGQRRPAPAGA
jgi:uncharacterized repeat protein (TIGR01451 family)